MGQEREQDPAGTAGRCSMMSGTSGPSRDGWPLFCDIWDLRWEDSKAGAHPAGGWDPLESSGAWYWAGMTCSLGQAIGLHSNGLSVCLTFLTARWPLNSWTSLKEAQAPWTSVPRRERQCLLWRSLRTACHYPCSGDQSSHKPTRIEGST